MVTAIITGASSGLGREYALALKKMHPDIESFWLIARRRERLVELSKTLGEEKCFVFPLDLTDKESFKELSNILNDTKPEIKYLINNSGCGKLGSFENNTESDISVPINLNCLALSLVTNLCLPYMSAGSEIINVCSIAAFAPNPGMAVYCSTKAYVMSFSRAISFELKKRKINVLAVCPGPMDTEFLFLANITKGKSHTFDTLPRVNPKTVAYRSLKASQKGKSVYTNKFFYKFYRFFSKVFPHSLVMHFSKT